jgi:hypothetical protein
MVSRLRTPNEEPEEDGADGGDEGQTQGGGISSDGRANRLSTAPHRACLQGR